MWTFLHWNRKDFQTGAYGFNLKILLSLLPITVFWVMRNFTDTEIAIGIGFATSIAVFRITRQQGVVGFLAVLALLVVGGAALFGVFFASDKVFLANDPVSDFLWGILFIGSVLVRRPIVGLLTNELFPNLINFINVRNRVFYILTIIWALYYIGTGMIRMFLLEAMSVDSYILWSRMIVWPMTLLLFIISVYVIRRSEKKQESKIKS